MDSYLFEVIEAPLPRKKIEVDLLTRHKRLKQKIDSLKVLRAKEELKNNTSVPTINPTSRKLASKSARSLITTSSRLERTYRILSTSRFLPKQVSLNLGSLTTQQNSPQTSKNQPSHRFTDRPSPVPSPITFPSLEGFSNPGVPGSHFFPSDILKRNQLLSSLRAEVLARGFAKEPEEPREGFSASNIHERCLAWQKQKNARLEELRTIKESKKLDGCTFKPEFLSHRSQVFNQTPRTSASDFSYVQLFQKKQAFRGKTRSERNFSQETKACTAVQSARISCSVSSVPSPKYSSLCPVDFPLCIPNGARVLRRFLGQAPRLVQG